MRYLVAASLLLVAACTIDSRTEIMRAPMPAADLRSLQSRVAAGTSKPAAFAAAASALTSLGFVIGRSDAAAGLIIARSASDDALFASVALTEDDGRILIRLSETREDEAVTSASSYQRFFASLGQQIALAPVARPPT